MRKIGRTVRISADGIKTTTYQYIDDDERVENYHDGEFKGTHYSNYARRREKRRDIETPETIEEPGRYRIVAKPKTRLPVLR